MLQVLKPKRQAEVEVANAETPRLQHVVWYRDQGLRRLYGLLMVLCLASATTGYDGFVTIQVYFSKVHLLMNVLLAVQCSTAYRFSLSGKLTSTTLLAPYSDFLDQSIVLEALLLYLWRKDIACLL